MNRLKLDFLGYLTNKIKTLDPDSSLLDDFFDDRNISEMEVIELFEYLDKLEVVEEK